MIKKPQQKPRLSVPQFLYKTYELVENPESQDICSWSEQGDSFIIKNINQFCDKVLTSYFKTNNLASFVRQLNMYGFHKIRNEYNQSEFQHKYFKRGQKHLLIEIKRKSTNTVTQQLKENQEGDNKNMNNNNGMIQQQQTEDNPQYTGEKLEYSGNNNSFGMFQINPNNTSNNNTNNVSQTNLNGVPPLQQPPNNQQPLNSNNNNQNQNMHQFGNDFNSLQQYPTQNQSPYGNGNSGKQTSQPDLIYLLKKQKEQESQIENLNSLHFQSTREVDGFKKKLQELERAMTVLLSQHDQIVSENRLLWDEIRRNREKEEKRTEKVMYNIMYLFQQSQKQSQKGNVLFGSNPYNGGVLYDKSNPISPVTVEQDSFRQPSKSDLNQSNPAPPQKEEQKKDQSQQQSSQQQEKPKTQNDSTKDDSVQQDKQMDIKPEDQIKNQKKENKEDWSSVMHIEKNGEKIPVCDLKFKKKRKQENKLNHNFQQVMKSLLGNDDTPMDNLLNQHYIIPAASKMEFDTPYQSLLQKRVNPLAQGGIGFLDNRKKLCGQGEENNGNNNLFQLSQQTPTQLFNGLPLQSPSQFYSPMYEQQGGLMNYMLSGANSPLQYFNGNASGISPIPIRGEAENKDNEKYVDPKDPKFTSN